jgi:hypothetical protein
MNYNDGCEDCDNIVGIEWKMLASLPGGPDLVALKLASLAAWLRLDTCSAL